MKYVQKIVELFISKKIIKCFKQKAVEITSKELSQNLWIKTIVCFVSGIGIAPWDAFSIGIIL